MSDIFLVLGSSGLIGKSLVSYLRNKDHEVLEFDIAADPLQDLRIPNHPLLAEYIQQADFIFFLAFDVGGYKYLSTQQHSYNFIDNNIRLQSNVFELLKHYKKKFIFTSTQMSAIRYLPYGTLKVLGELYTHALGGLYVRLWNVYGKEENSEKAHVITDFILKARTEGKITMLTDGTEERQFLYVDDCVECLYKLALEYDTLPRNIPLHITSFEWVSIKHVAECISSKLGNVPVVAGSYIDNVQIHYKNEPDTTILQYWKPSVTLESGLEKIIKEN